VLWHCWVGGRKGIRPVEKTEWWVADMVICLERGADLRMAQLMPLLLTVSCFSKIDVGLPFWYRLTRVVPDKGPLNGCVCYWHLIKWMLRPLCLFCLTSVLLIISTNEVNIIIIFSASQTDTTLNCKTTGDELYSQVAKKEVFKPCTAGSWRLQTMKWQPNVW